MTDDHIRALIFVQAVVCVLAFFTGFAIAKAFGA